MVAEVQSSSVAQVTKVIREESASVDKQAAFPEASVRELGNSGLLGLLVPARYGGQESGAKRFSQVALETGAACGSTGMIFVMHCCGVEVISNLMPECSTKDEILRAVADGKHLSTLACSERGTGTHFYASFSKSNQENEYFRLNAEKSFVTSGGYANSYVVSTQATGEDNPLNTSLYLVLKDGGQTFSGQWQGMGLRGNSSCNMSLKEVMIPQTQLLGKSGDGLALSMSLILPRFLLGTSAVYTGIAEAAFMACVEHVNQRVHAHTSEALSALPTIRRSIAEMKVAVDVCKRYLEYAAGEFDEQPAHPDLLITLFEAKALAAKTAKEVSMIAAQVGGGIAYSGQLPIERYLRDAMAGSVMAPTTDVLLDLIGKAALGQPLL
jgi:isovaleryl-CoA dehydrogenase